MAVAELVFKAAFGDLIEAKGVLGDLKDKTQEVQKEADKMGESLSLAGKAGAAIGAAIGTGISAIGALTAVAISNADAMGELSQSLMVSTESLSGWAYGAKQAGVSQEQLAGAITKLNTQIDNAVSGQKTATEAFTRLGVSVKDAGGNVKSTEQVFYEVADAFAGLEDSAGKAALASDVFGKAAGPALVPYLNQGAEGIKNLNAEALRFGLIISQDVADKAGAFNDKIDQMKGVVGGVGTQIAAGLLPTLNKMATMLLDTANDTGSMSGAVGVLDSGLKLLISTGMVVTQVFKGLGTMLGAVAAALVQAASGDFSQAFDTLKQGALDVQASGQKMRENIGKVWSDTGNDVEAKAPKIGKQLAAPIAEGSKEAEKEAKKMQSIIEGIYNMNDPSLQWKKKMDEATKAYKSGGLPKGDYQKAMGTYQGEIDKINFTLTDQEKAANAAMVAQEKLLGKYVEMGDPLQKYLTQMNEVNDLMDKYPEKAAQLANAQLTIQEAYEKARDAAKDNATEQTGLMKDLIQAAEGYSKSMSSAFVDWMAGAGGSFKDMVRGMITEIAKLIMYKAVFQPLTNGIMGMFGFANGGVFANGSPTPYADGMINSPTMFPMANGNIGLAGESGAEAIMPLRRDANGRLGVSGGGGNTGINVGSISVNIGEAKAEDGPAISKAAQEGIERAFRGLVQTEIFNQTRMGNALNPIPLTGF